MAAPPQAANAAVEDARIRSLVETVEGASINRVTKDFFRSAIEEFRRVMMELESGKAQKEAQVQQVMELETENAQKEAEVQQVMEESATLHAMLDKKVDEVEKLMAEIVTLQTMLDKKEAQLQAMSEQCKLMALNHHN